jgi:hypothetical protein
MFIQSKPNSAAPFRRPGCLSNSAMRVRRLEDFREDKTEILTPEQYDKLKEIIVNTQDSSLIATLILSYESVQLFKK